MKGAAINRLWLAAVLTCTSLTSLAASTNAPVVPSPVRVLRELLAQPAAERAQSLAMYPDGLREPLEAKVKEYLAMASDARELRLQATDLRHYLLQLLPLDRPAQIAALTQVPESIREIVQERLDWWQLHLPEMQEEFLENEQVVHYFTQMGISSEEMRQGLLDVMPPGERERMEARIASWQALPDESRRRVFAQFNQMFDLTPEEQHRTLRTLSEEEREAMNRTLAAFSHLTPEKRLVCVRSFERFSQLNLVERREFLRKAEAWERMSPAERQQWRELVEIVPDLPPFPPGVMPRVAVPMPTPATNGG